MRRWILRAVAGLVALAVLALLAGYATLRASLPPLDGERTVAGLGATARVERDARGSVTVTARSRADLAFALGYAHAQDRWFQMDLLRRAAAGELSALLGPATLDTDRELRVHRFRTVAREVLARAPADQRVVLEAYTAGANAGLASLGARPWEYFALGVRPEPWRAEDSVLGVLAMYLELQEPGARTERQRGLLRETLPPSVAAFLDAKAPAWDAALDGSVSAAPVVPPASDYDLRRLGDLDFVPPPRGPRSQGLVGSNNWAVAGRRTASGTAIVANDMHLGLRVPNTWYHARLRLEGGAAPLDVTGVTLPGTPATVTGSTGRVAWAFTNSYGDYADVIVAVPDPADPSRYLSPDGPRPFRTVTETIAVAGAEPVRLEVRLTAWGPVIGTDARGRALALQWTAHDPAATNLELVALEHAASVDDALAIAARAGIPAQNFVTGDASGRIAWTIAGQIPRRRGGDASAPRPSTDASVGFDGWVDAAARPRLVDPADGQLQTANARVVGGEALATIGDAGYDRGARNGQIAAALRAAGDRQTPADSLAVHLDDRALFLERWRALLDGLLDAAAVEGNASRAEQRAVLAKWSGRAAVDDPAYRLVRAFRDELERMTFYALIAPARTKHPDFRWRIPPSFEGPLWALVEARPAHLLPPAHADWRGFMLAAADAAAAGKPERCESLAACTWGRANTARIRHALSPSLPGPLAAVLDMPATELPGDRDMPRVQGRSFGASQRFAVPVGRESEGWFHMPSGQSAHPLSRFHGAGHADWERGTATPFLPGRAVHALTLVPGAAKIAR